MQLIDDQTYTLLVASAIVTTVIVSPLVSRMSGSSRRYKPHARRTIQHTMPSSELRLLTCIHDKDAVPSILNLLQVTNPTRHNPLCIYVMQLMDLVGRAAPLLIPYKTPLSSSRSSSSSNAIFAAFCNLQQTGCVWVQPYVCISPFSTMHDDVCSLALQNKVSLILLPFHKRLSVAGTLDVVDYALQTCNPNILRHAPCSVGILVDRGDGRYGGASAAASALYRIGALFLGGADDREALAYADRMSSHPSAVLTVTRVAFKDSYRFGEKAAREKHLDDEVVSEFRRRQRENGKVAYQDMVVQDGEEAINAISSMEEVYDLMVVGRCQWCGPELMHCLSMWSENPELGLIGDLCFSSDCFGGKASVLVMQQQTRTAAAVSDLINSKRT